VLTGVIGSENPHRSKGKIAMDLELAGLRALVLGSGRGIGLACAQRLAREGCRVALHGRDAAALEEARLAIGAEASLVADLAQPEVVRRMVESAVAALGGACSFSS
jgi:3-oxoacyl-[acyl-carrier protein] reductase